MPVIKCPLDTYATPDVHSVVAASLLNLHNNIHINANLSSSKPNPQRWTVLLLGETAMKRFGANF